MGHFWSSQVTNFLKQLFLIWKLILWHFAHCLHELVAQETREAICGIFMLIGTPLNKSLIIWVETMCHYDVKWNSQSHHQRQENVTHKRKGTVEATILLTVNRGQILGHEGKIIELCIIIALIMGNLLIDFSLVFIFACPLWKLLAAVGIFLDYYVIFSMENLRILRWNLETLIFLNS